MKEGYVFLNQSCNKAGLLLLCTSVIGLVAAVFDIAFRFPISVILPRIILHLLCLPYGAWLYICTTPKPHPSETVLDVMRLAIEFVLYGVAVIGLVIGSVEHHFISDVVNFQARMAFYMCIAVVSVLVTRLGKNEIN